MKINVSKTKNCVFEKRKSNNNCHFHINNEEIDVVESFTYLGMKLSYTGNMSSAVKARNDQALKAYHSLLKLFDRISLDVKTKLTLFDTMVLTIMLYGSEVWGVYNFKSIDKLHLRFCKYILGVKKQTPNNAVLGELGRFPISVLCRERSLKFLCKIMSKTDSPIYFMYKDLCDNVRGNCWTSRIKSIIDHLGYSQLRYNFNTNSNTFHNMKQTLRDQFLQEWNTNINSLPKLDYFCKFKEYF